MCKLGELRSTGKNMQRSESPRHKRPRSGKKKRAGEEDCNPLHPMTSPTPQRQKQHLSEPANRLSRAEKQWRGQKMTSCNPVSPSLFGIIQLSDRADLLQQVFGCCATARETSQSNGKCTGMPAPFCAAARETHFVLRRRRPPSSTKTRRESACALRAKRHTICSLAKGDCRTLRLLGHGNLLMRPPEDPGRCPRTLQVCPRIRSAPGDPHGSSHRTPRAPAMRPLDADRHPRGDRVR